MTLYIARRLLWTVIVVFAVLAIVYAVFFLLPAGDPAVRFAGKQPTPVLLAEIRHRLGLDHPWYTQFWIFVKTFFKGDEYGWPGLGKSFLLQVSVLSIVKDGAPRTLWLIFGAAVIWLSVGIPIGILSALKRRTFVDRLAMGFALFGISAPVFWLGQMALWLVWYKAGLTAGSGYVGLTQDPVSFLSHMILPWIVLAVLFAAFYARMVRRNLLDTLGEDYIRTARAKGLRERTVIFRHGLRASLTGVVTMLGLDMALLVGGAVITETVFNLQGLGYDAVQGAFQQDLPMVIGVTMVTAIAVALANLIVDIAYAFLDPRVRYA